MRYSNEIIEDPIYDEACALHDVAEIKAKGVSIFWIMNFIKEWNEICERLKANK